MAKKLSPLFGDELRARGLNEHLSFSLDDGTVWGRERLTAEQQVALDEAIAAHDPTAWREPAAAPAEERPLTGAERRELRALLAKLKAQGTAL